MTGWYIRSCIGLCLAGAFSLAAIISCGVSKTVATEAVNKAEAAGRKLEENNVPQDKTLYYRLHMEQARAALEKKKHTRAREEADKAKRAADNLLENREILRGRTERELKEMWRIAESEPYPAEATVEACFAAQSALEENRVEEAYSVLQAARQRAGMQVKITSSRTVVIQATDSYYKKKKYIPVYQELVEGRPRGLILELDQPAGAKFLGSEWISPELRYVKVRIETREEDYIGWVEGRFISR